VNTERVGELSKRQRTSAARTVNRQRRESVSRRFFVFRRVSSGLSLAAASRKSLCLPEVPFGTREGQLNRALSRAKLYDSLNGPGRGVNTRVSFGVLAFF